MKKIVSVALCACFVCMFIKADAFPKRVGYYGNQIPGQDFTSLQAAHDASSSGDTILIYPGTWSANYNRKLVTIGAGYFINPNISGANPNLQTATGNVAITVNLYSGSNNNNFEGLDNFSLIARAYVDSISVKRCRAHFSLYGNLLNKWEITQSIILNINDGCCGSTPKFTELLVQNCFIEALTGGYIGDAKSTGVFKNNIFGTNHMNFKAAEYVFINNIFLGTNFTNFASCTFKYNIGTGNVIPPGNGNKPDVDITKVCVGYPTQGNYSNDERFKIKPTGPAAGAGEDGEDCGMFGGPDPYRLSGIPPIPAFYKLTAPSSTATSNPYTITFSVRGNN